MPETRSSVTGLAEELIAEHKRITKPTESFGRITKYLRGDHDLPYMPKGAKAEYRHLAKKSITNWLPLISGTFVKGLFVDGYRPARATTNAPAWQYWQANGMDARQTIPHRGALEYGASYVLVLPGTDVPLMRPLAPTKTVAFFEDEDDEWAVHGLYVKGKDADGTALYELFTDDSRHLVGVPKGEAKPKVLRTDVHALGVTPLVRYRDRLDGEARGIILPLIVLQDRINEAVFALLIALQYASFRQRWATGLSIPVDEETGAPVEPFKAAVDRLWVTDNPDAKFGDFAQTEVGGHLETYGSGVRSLAAIAELSPHVLLGDLVNLSADALAAAEASTQRKIGEYETVFGESHEQAFRLASLAAGNREAARDTSAEVRWRDTEARSLAAAVDALGKMVQMLGVPAEGAWERIPGVTDQDIERWRGMASSADGLRQLAEALTRQSATPALPATAEATPAA